MIMKLKQKHEKQQETRQNRQRCEGLNEATAPPTISRSLTDFILLPSTFTQVLDFGISCCKPSVDISSNNSRLWTETHPVSHVKQQHSEEDV